MVKFANKRLCIEALRDTLSVVTRLANLNISSLERQVAFKKYYLKSDKDAEYAGHIEELLKNTSILKRFVCIRNLSKMKWLKAGNNNKEDRMNFVKYRADYVKTHPDKVWSKQQKVIIDSQIQNARHYKLSAEGYFKIKGGR